MAATRVAGLCDLCWSPREPNHDQHPGIKKNLELRGPKRGDQVVGGIEVGEEGWPTGGDLLAVERFCCAGEWRWLDREPAERRVAQFHGVPPDSGSPLPDEGGKPDTEGVGANARPSQRPVHRPLWGYS